MNKTYVFFIDSFLNKMPLKRRNEFLYKKHTFAKATIFVGGGICCLNFLSSQIYHEAVRRDVFILNNFKREGEKREHFYVQIHVLVQLLQIFRIIS